MKDYLGVIYISEDRVLTDMIYDFKTIRDFPREIQYELVALKNYRSVMHYTTFTLSEMEKIQSIRVRGGKVYPFKSKKLKRCYFSLEGRKITVTDVYHKESMNLQGAHIFIDHDP